jgi:hypothetical protein
MAQLKEILIRRLNKKGIELRTIPGFIRSFSSSFYIDPSMSLVQLNDRMRYMGWEDIELDYYTFQLVVEMLEACGLKKQQYKPAHWFEKNFMMQ